MTHNQGSRHLLYRRLPRAAGRALVLVALCGAGIGISPLAQTAEAPPVAQSEPAGEARLSASQAAAIVQKQYGGKVLKVQPREKNGRLVYRVKILQDSGRLRTVGVDAQTGRLISS